MTVMIQSMYTSLIERCRHDPYLQAIRITNRASHNKEEKQGLDYTLTSGNHGVYISVISRYNIV